MLFSFCRNPDIFQKATHQKGLDRRYDIVVIKIQPSIEESKKKSEKFALSFPQEEKHGNNNANYTRTRKEIDLNMNNRLSISDIEV